MHDGKRVGGGLDGGEDVLAVAVGFGGAGELGGYVGELDRDVREGGALGIREQAANTTLVGLCSGGEGGQTGEQDGCVAEKGAVVKLGPAVLLVHRCDPEEAERW